MPAYLPATDDWVKANVESSVRNQMTSELMAQYPNIPQSSIEGRVEETFRMRKKTIALNLENRKEIPHG